jgi:cyanophycinase
MARGPIFLVGGGWVEAGYQHTWGRFAAAVGTGEIACVLLDGPDRDAYFARNVDAFAAVGASNLRPVFVSPTHPLRADDLAGAGGILIGGGLTPDYYDAIVPAASAWLPMVLERGIPYAGFSAGAMIAPDQGIIGGWKLRRVDGDADLAICSEDVAEDVAYLDVRPGLGLVPFAVDVHASQYGTPTRLLHAVNRGVVPEGWAVDEDTMLEVINGQVTVHGLGSAYHVREDGASLSVTIVPGDAA